jgi:hypothetical protein
MNTNEKDEELKADGGAGRDQKRVASDSGNDLEII